MRVVLPGVVVTAETADSLELRADAALLIAPAGSLLSHHTAAALRGLPVPPSDEIHVTVPPGCRLRVGGIRPHDADREPEEVGGRRLSNPADTFLDLASYLSLLDLVVLGDAMVRRGLIGLGALRSAAAARRGRGVRRARTAAALVRPRVDSPRETWSRLLPVWAGLPEPMTGYVIRDDDGGWIAEVDLAYKPYRVAIEYDGDLHRTTRRKWRGDVAKRELLRQMGWVVIVLTADDLDVRPAATVRRVVEALRAAGCGVAVPAAVDTHYR